MDAKSLLSWHDLAQRFGDGLKPELLAALTREHDTAYGKAVPLNAPQKSAGPAHQFASEDRLKELGIPRLSDRVKKEADRNGTDG